MYTNIHFQNPLEISYEDYKGCWSLTQLQLGEGWVHPEQTTNLLLGNTLTCTPSGNL